MHFATVCEAARAAYDRGHQSPERIASPINASTAPQTRAVRKSVCGFRARRRAFGTRTTNPAPCVVGLPSVAGDDIVTAAAKRDGASGWPCPWRTTLGLTDGCSSKR
jgi:hypothetical protein